MGFIKSELQTTASRELEYYVYSQAINYAGQQGLIDVLLLE